MKYHPIFKALAILLAAAALVVSAAGAFGVCYLGSYNLYTEALDTWLYLQQESLAYDIANHVMDRYAADGRSDCPQGILEMLGYCYDDQTIGALFDLDATQWQYQITDSSGSYVEGVTEAGFKEGMSRFHFDMVGRYPVLVAQREVYEQPRVYMGEEIVVEATESPRPADEAWVEAAEYVDYDRYEINGVEYAVRYETAGSYTVSVWLDLEVTGYYNTGTVELLKALYPYRVGCIWLCVGGLLMFVLCMVYLGLAAGRSRKNALCRAGGLNRIPLDLYLAAAAGLCVLAMAISVVLLENAWDFGYYNAPGTRSFLILGLLALLLAAVTVVGFLFALIAQLKNRGGFWWRNSIVGRIFRLIGRVIRFGYRGLRRLFYLLPLVWQWVLTAVAMVAVPAFFLLLAFAFEYGFGLQLSLLSLFGAIGADIALVCYGAYAFGTLRKGAKAMSQGNLGHKISTKYLVGCFREFADHLNTISNAARLAAQNEMKSERMKTELITNVSHDIKTPLTSLINYVDLLQKPHTEAEGAQYLEVLDRQSQRLKKLIDDLMEMSKASTGNMAVQLETLDMTETVNQALGEFADKLAGRGFQVMFAPPKEPVKITADGRLTWRVLSNVLSNVVKYAMPGTRVYLDIRRYQSHVLLSVKNISTEPLNVSAQELTERFVRGDASRNTEGSGLGLNIAQSLMELQQGKLSLLVDGDLFKVTLTFREG